MQGIELPDDSAIALSLRNLRTIVAIAEEGSLTAAGARLGYAQATVSMHLAAAESSLGVSLFRRNGRGVVATDAGHSVLRHATTLFGTLADLRSDASHTSRHKLTIGATEPAASRHLLTFFKRYEHDNPDVELAIRIEPCIELLEQIERGAFDIAILSANRAKTHGIKFTALYDEELVLLAPSGHRLTGERSVTLQDLAGERLVLADERCGYRLFIETLLAEANIDVNIRTGIGNITTMPSSVAAALGVSIVPREMVTPAPSGTIAVRFRDRLSVKMGVALRTDAPAPARRLAAQMSRDLARGRHSR
jgi:LysR family transcriptional regulator, regulator of the ytmI operon